MDRYTVSIPGKEREGLSVCVFSDTGKLCRDGINYDIQIPTELGNVTETNIGVPLPRQRKQSFGVDVCVIVCGR